MAATPSQPSNEPTRRVICSQCGARSWLHVGEERACRECGGAFRDMGLLEGFVDRWFAPPEKASEFYPRHLKLIELMWTARGRGQETFEALDLQKVSYTQFVTRATEVVLQGLREGWIEARIPTAPIEDDDQYAIHFLDPDRWADALLTAFEDKRRVERTDAVRLDVEGDPDLF